MERSKPASPEQDAKPSSSSTASGKSGTNTVPAATRNASSEERVRDLERRLGALDSGEKNTSVATITNTLIVHTATSAIPAQESDASSTAPSSPNPLLKRIQAAQERARIAEQKERKAKKAAEEDRRRREKEIEEEIVQKATESQAELDKRRHEKIMEIENEAERIQKAQSALRSVAERALEDKFKNNVPTLEGDGFGDGSRTSVDTTAAPPCVMDASTLSIATVGVVEQPTVAVPIMKSLDPLPPSLPSINIPSGVSTEMVGHGMNSHALSEQQQLQQQQNNPEAQVASRTMKPDPPPSFNIDEQQWRYSSVQSTKPKVPPPAAFHRVQQPVDPPTLVEDGDCIDTITEYDESGNHLTPEQRQALLDDQRKLYESIMKEKADNDAAIARANSDLFYMRSSNPVARAMTGADSLAGQSMIAESTAAPGGESTASSAAGLGAVAAASATTAPLSSSSQRLITIGGNQTVALHGQEMTKKAISDGTAILTQCVNCHNWMQVTGKATLMLCPICRVVSPVVKQNEVLTREEAIQLTKDRKLAEKLQAELNHGKDGVVAEDSAGSAVSQHQSDSWWNRLSSIVSYGVADEDHPRGELGVTRPPGSITAPVLSQYPAQRRGNTSSPGVVTSSNVRPSAESSAEMVGHGMNSRFLSDQQRRTTVTPSAPPHAAADLLDHLHGLQPIALPLSTNAQSEMQQASSTVHDEGIDAISDFDENGNPLTLEQRRVLLDEQRKLYESIMKEKAENDAAIAEVNADSFDMRSSSAAYGVMPRRKVADASGAAGARTLPASSMGQEGGIIPQSSQRRIKIGSNQTVALRGQESTKKAIKDGTAIIVQCINCQHWMQITGSASLMLCPICQVVSPVRKQNEVVTKEDAIQLTIDRKLAEKLQAEMNDGEVPQTKTEEGYFTRFFGYSSENVDAASPPTSSSAAVAQQQSDSWWSRISSIASYGVADEAHHRGELGVTRPPGSLVGSASQYPAQICDHTSSVAFASNNDSVARNVCHSARNEETQGLLAPVVVDGNEENLPPGRVAERQPLFSCVVNSVSSAAAAVFVTGDTDSDNAGDYSRLSDLDR